MQIDLNKTNIQSLIIFLLKEQKIGTLSVKIPITKSYNHLLNTNNCFSRKPQNASATIKNNFFVKEFFFYGGTITCGFGDNESQPTRLKDYLMCYQLESKVDEYLTDSIIKENIGKKEYDKRPHVAESGADRQQSALLLTKQPKKRSRPPTKCAAEFLISQGRLTKTADQDTREYDYLIWLLQKKYLKPQQVKEVLSKLLKENILELFISQQGQASFKEGYSLNPICHSSITINTIYQLNNIAKTWKQFKPFIVSPYQYPCLENKIFLKENISEASYKNITEWSESQKTLIELSRQLNCSLVDVGRAFYPYVKKKLIVFQTKL